MVVLSVVVAPAYALECPAASMTSRVEQADAAFVGTLVSSRPAAGGERIYRWNVLQPVKGAVGGEIDIRAPLLVFRDDRPVGAGVEAGVLATLDGATFVTDSCGLTDPGALLAAVDEPKGGAIKLVVGGVILVAVLVYSGVRVRRRGTSVR